MVEKIKTPKYFLEEIKKDSIEAKNQDMEATGDLLGEYLPEEDAISAVERHPFPYNSGTNNFEDLFRMYVIGFPNFVSYMFKTNSHSRKLKKEWKEPASIIYHSHPDDTSWSDTDREKIPQWDHFLPNSWLLYLVKKDEFKALNHKLEEIPIEIIEDEY